MTWSLALVLLIAFALWRAGVISEIGGLVSRLAAAQSGRAATWDPTWRGSPFRVGGRYVVVKSTSSVPSSDTASPGEVLIYQGSGYRRYDSCSIYAFVTESGQERSWWLSDDEPLETWRQTFTSLDELKEWPPYTS